MKKNIFILITLIIIIGVGFFVWNKPSNQIAVTNFEDCAALGDPVMESYPRKCQYNGETFTENIGNELDKVDLIKVTSPRPNQTITSPLIITGEARGKWFFEANFPVTLTNWEGKTIAEGFATANGEWMTENFVPFEAKLTFIIDKNIYSNKGTLILKKSNASDLREHDDSLEMPVIFDLK